MHFRMLLNPNAYKVNATMKMQQWKYKKATHFRDYNICSCDCYFILLTMCTWFNACTHIIMYIPALNFEGN